MQHANYITDLVDVATHAIVDNNKHNRACTLSFTHRTTLRLENCTRCVARRACCPVCVADLATTT